MRGRQPRMSFYSPLKPIDSSVPSGDRGIARGLYHFFIDHGWQPFVASRLVSRRSRSQPQLPSRFLLSFKVARAAIRTLRAKPDVLLTYHNYYKAPDWLHPIVSLLSGCPYVIYEGSFKPSTRQTDPLTYWWMWWSFQQAAAIFTDVRRDYDQLVQHFPNKTFYLKPGLKLPLASPRTKAANSPPVLISTAMLRADRKFPSVQWLVETLAEMQSGGDKFVFRHIGGGQKMADLQALCQELLRPGSYQLLGTLDREQINKELADADIFVYPGIGESFGMVYLEAQAQGLPVVAFANGGVAEAVADQQSGFLVAPLDRERFKQRIRQLMQNEGLRQKMGNAAREYVREQHDQAKNYGQIIETIDELQQLTIQPTRATQRIRYHLGKVGRFLS